MLLPNNHPSLSKCVETKSIFNSLMGNTEISFFDYGKFYDDGRCLFLPTQANVVKCLFKNEWQPTIPEHIKTQENIYYIRPKKDFNSDLLHQIESRYNLVTILDIIKRGVGYYELFCFGLSNTDIDRNINFCLNQKDPIERFTKDFKKTASSIIEPLEDHLIWVPDHMRSNVRGFTQHHKREEKPFRFNSTLLDISFTERQTECLYYLSRGYSAKDIARVLNISHRTIESFINQIKIKLHCTRKQEIIKFINENNLFF
ncbi:MAG TPA: helix-turn-helix transcriptional regulator [Gammaproteobacteria bacterium]|nr:helix-turn-helix transcriptional regulator [Gammaproteobacteria bacterium]